MSKESEPGQGWSRVLPNYLGAKRRMIDMAWEIYDNVAQEKGSLP
jgi:hypothetical protein